MNDAFDWGSKILLLLEHFVNKFQVKDVALLDMHALSLLRSEYLKKPINNVLLTI